MALPCGNSNVTKAGIQIEQNMFQTNSMITKTWKQAPMLLSTVRALWASHNYLCSSSSLEADAKVTKLNAKPPQESVSRIELTRGMTHVAPRSYILTNGAKAYPGLAKKHGLKHEKVNHAVGEFTRLVRRGPGRALKVHTGGTDNTWKQVKDKIPGIHTLEKGKLKAHFMKHVRQWQCPAGHQNKCLMTAIAIYLTKVYRK